MLTAMGMGCAARGAQVEHAGSAAKHCSGGSIECSRAPRAATIARRDVVTWREYYTGVMDDAFRRNSTVIWINPPKPIRNVAEAQGTLPPDLAPTGLGH
jgi:hypothetical protein